MPWLPPSFKRGKAGEFRMTVSDIAQPVTVRAGETLLDAGLRQGLALPYECRNGGCGVCRCTVLHGSVDHGVYQRSALPDALRARGEALMCCATPLSDLEIEVVRATGAAPAAINAHVGRIDALERLAEDLIRLTVSLPGGERITFAAGQYINIVLADGQRRAYSFANAPHDNERIELHVRRIPGGRFTGHVFTEMKVGDTLHFEGPLGGFALRESERPILFVAGATGFAPVKSIVEDAFHRGLRRPMWLYWGVRRRHDLYMADLAERWQREHDNFHFVPVLSHAEPADAWTWPVRPGPRSDARGFPRHERLRGLRVRFGEDGRGGGAGVHRTWLGRGPLLLRRVHAIGRTARVATGLSIVRGRDSPSVAPPPRRCSSPR